MKPADFFKLPDQRVANWTDNFPSYMRKVFGFDDVDGSTGDPAELNRLLVHEKLSASDGIQAASMRALSFDGMPFAIVIGGKDGRRAVQRHVITDKEVFGQAASYLQEFRLLAENKERDIADSARDLPVLDRICRMVVAEFDGEKRLVPVNRAADDGTAIFDDVAFQAAFDELVRPLYDRLGSLQAAMFCDNRPMRVAALNAIDRAIPEELDRLRMNHLETSAAKSESVWRWHGVVIKTTDGTYSVGLDWWHVRMNHLSWVSGLSGHRLGGPELFERIATAARRREPSAEERESAPSARM